MKNTFDKYKFLVVSVAVLVLMLVKYPLLVSIPSSLKRIDVNEDYAKKMAASAGDLKLYLSSNGDAEEVSAEKIIGIAKQAANNQLISTNFKSEEKNKIVCEESLLHVSRVLSETQGKLTDYENREKEIPWIKIAIFILTSGFAFGAHLLVQKKEKEPKSSEKYEKWASNLNLISIIVLGFLGVFS